MTEPVTEPTGELPTPEEALAAGPPPQREPITQGNPVLVETGADEDDVDRVCWTWCPACQAVHQWTVDQRPDAAGEQWGWDGDTRRPSFVGEPLEVEWRLEDGTDYLCRSRLVDGGWVFHADSTHDLAGQTVPMVPVPDWLRDLT